jgi:hypothetical protein
MADIVPVQLAYEAAVRAIADQASVVESLRSRAGTIFAATALVTSFLGGFALAGAAEEIEPGSRTGIAIGIFVVLAVLTLAILWPYRLRFSISAREMLAIVDARSGDNPVTGAEAYRELALRYETMYEFNAVRVRVLLWCFRLAIVCLVAEVAMWIAILEEVR